MTNWRKNSRRRPAAYRCLDVVTEDGREFSGICWSPYRGEFIEPITGMIATPVIGPIEKWRYSSEMEQEADIAPPIRIF